MLRGYVSHPTQCSFKDKGLLVVRASFCYSYLLSLYVNAAGHPSLIKSLIIFFPPEVLFKGLLWLDLAPLSGLFTAQQVRGRQLQRTKTVCQEGDPLLPPWIPFVSSRRHFQPIQRETTTTSMEKLALPIHLRLTPDAVSLQAALFTAQA